LQFSETTQARIFRNDGKFHYEGNIHNKPIVDYPYMFAPQIVFHHYGYMFEGKEKLMMKKKKRSLPILEKEYAKNPHDLHISTHLIKTYSLTHEIDKVIKFGEVWMKDMRKIKYHEGWFSFLEVFVQLIGAYIIKNDTKNILRVEREVKRYSDRILSIYIMIGNYYSNKNRQKARKYFEKAILLGRENGGLYEQLLTSNIRIIIPEIMNYMALEYFEAGEYRKAGEYINDGILLNQNRLPLRWDIFNEETARKRLVQNGT